MVEAHPRIVRSSRGSPTTHSFEAANAGHHLTGTGDLDFVGLDGGHES